MTFHDQFGIDGTGGMALSLYHQRYNMLARYGSGAWPGKADQMFFSGNKGATKRGFRERLVI